jgi:hypothetical protein
MYSDINIDASGKLQSPPGAEIQSRTVGFLARGLTVGIALHLDQTAVLSGAAATGEAPAAVAALAKRNNITSFMIDYEPSTNITLEHATAYAKVVGAFAAAMHSIGGQLDMCVSDWSILTYFKLYAETGVDAMMSMAST